MPDAISVLLIEDNPIHVRLLQALLQEAKNPAVEIGVAGDLAEGLQRLHEGGIDVLLLDLVLPGTTGLEILRQLRQVRPTHPVIILSALGDESDRVAGLRLGADDYVVKPFGVKELLARVEAVLRRSPERPSDVVLLDLPGGTADLHRQEVRFDDGQRTELSTREIELLRYLASNAGRAISRDEILANVWRISPHGLSTRTIDMHVARLREKLRDDPQCPRVLLTVRGKGYMYACRENGS